MESRNQLNKLSWRPQLVPGLPVPLFERFDEELDDRRVLEPYCIQSVQLLLESIETALSSLLNTRLPPREGTAFGWESISDPETILDYGIPAFSSLESGRMTDHKLLSEIILKKIRSFEPRLLEPKLELRQDPENQAALLGMLEGKVRLNSVVYPIEFSLKLDEGRESAAAIVDPSEIDMNS